MAKRPSISRADILAAYGYRQLRPAELTARGLSAKARAFETPAGTIVSRRQADKLALPVSPERYARDRAADLGKSPLTTSTRLARAYAAKHGIGIRAAQRSPEYQAARKQYMSEAFWNRQRATYRTFQGEGPREAFQGRAARYQRYPKGSSVDELLQRLGLRSKDDFWPVGDS